MALHLPDHTHSQSLRKTTREDACDDIRECAGGRAACCRPAIRLRLVMRQGRQALSVIASFSLCVAFRIAVPVV